MSYQDTPVHRSSPRILIVDDLPSIFGDFERVLTGALEDRVNLHELAAELLGELPTQKPTLELPDFKLAYISQGEDAIDEVREAAKAGAPFSLAFVDVRMPPGIDGVQTARRLLAIDPDMQIVLCTAYSDYDHAELNRALGMTDRVFILRKPFDPIEVQQLALGLCRKRDALWQERHMRMHLEMEVEARTKSLEQANIRLQHACAEADASRERMQEFLSRMSHELLTPLNAMLGYTDLLREDPEIPQLQREMIVDAHRGGLRLLSLVRRALLFQSLDRYHPPRVQIQRPVLSWVERACHEHADEARAKGLTWELIVEPEDAECACDTGLVSEVLSCLVENAVKFTQEGVVRTRVMVTQGCLFIDVWDTGIGVAPELQDKIFEPFRQGDDASTRKFEGAGLGLALVARACKILGAKIDMDSALGKGTRIGVQIPLD
jgi:signal transduction histidine kinase